MTLSQPCAVTEQVRSSQWDLFSGFNTVFSRNNLQRASSSFFVVSLTQAGAEQPAAPGVCLLGAQLCASGPSLGGSLPLAGSV